MPVWIPIVAVLALVAGASMLDRRATAKELAERYNQPLNLMRKLVNVAQEVGADPADLAMVIHFETGGEWQPDTVNRASGATGLIQFTRTTARRLGTSTEELALLTPVEQMEWVEQYLHRVRDGKWHGNEGAGPLDDLQAVAMAVFYPDARYVPTDWEFPNVVTRNNPGIKTPADYLRKVRNYAGDRT